MVEDNPADVRLTMEAFKDIGASGVMRVVGDGVEALAFLRREGKYADVPRPDIILLDLNMPKKDGREVLAEVKADEVLRRIPVIVLTTSRDEQDIYKAYSLHANCYIAKPIDLNQFTRMVRTIQEFWLEIAKLPVQ